MTWIKSISYIKLGLAKIEQKGNMAKGVFSIIFGILIRFFKNKKDIKFFFFDLEEFLN